LTKRVLIAAISSRPFVKAAAQAGYSVTALDVFADADTQQYAEKVFKVEYANSGFESQQLESVLDKLDLSQLEGFAYGSGFEAQPDLLARIQKRLPLIGNSPALVSKLKDPSAFFALLDSLYIPHPEVCFATLTSTEGWLRKESGGSGGSHVVHAQAGSALLGGNYYQRLKTGEPFSMLFAANGKEVSVIGFNQQWVAPTDDKPYRYGGIVGHADLPVAIKQGMQQVALKLTQSLGLRGLNSLDVVVNGHAFWVLEINPRLSSSLDLYQSPSANLFSLHMQAVAGDWGNFPNISSHSKARQVIYAAKDIVIAKDFVWPVWAADIPIGMTDIQSQQPVCTVLAEAGSAKEARALVEARAVQLCSLLFS
jgi:predicted ATP-grasp superfamily ATP-dependent carboligase